MGVYATTTSLDTLMVGVNFDTATSSLATKCITWSENEIDKKLCERYDVTDFKTTVPPIITSLCEQLSMGYLYRQLSRGGKESLNRGDTLIKGVMDNLNALADNKFSIVNTTGSVISSRTDRKTVLSSTNDYYPTFAEDDPLNWKVDSDKLSDIENDRG